MRDISKRFGSTTALSGAHFRARRAEITALVGENGAGKSTLMRILAGVERADEGEIFVQGEEVDFHGPRSAVRAGIGMVHQHFMLFDRLTVAENIVFGAEPARHGWYRKGDAETAVAQLCERVGLHVDPAALVGDLAVGQRQRVELLKVLYRGAEVLVLDEPTAVLTPQEADELFTVLRSLRESGRTIVFITHRLPEVFAISDAATVLRGGRVVGEVRTADVDAEALIHMMVGRSLGKRGPVASVSPGSPVLTVQNLSTSGTNAVALQDISFDIGGGEIVGIAGVSGNGQEQLVEALVGLRRSLGGRIELSGRDITNTTVKERRDLGLAFIPEDRFRRGLAGGESVLDNVAMGHFERHGLSRRGWLDRAAMRSWADQVVTTFNVRGGGTAARDLSGGNAQRLVVGRELELDSSLIIAEQPTRGVDIGATEQIRDALEAHRRAGTSVLLISADLEEITKLSQRILVMFDGRIVAEVPSGTDRYTIGRYMAGLGSSDGPGAEMALQ